jgi:XTP/dITP diphosphohydrolase
MYLKKTTIILATNNEHKLIEFQTMLAPKGIDIKPLSFLGEDTIDWIEDGASFYENALIKAQAIKKYTAHDVLADDSGLCVSALHGAPGIYSARYAGPNATDQENIQLLLKNMAGIKDRQAHFHCSLVLLNEEKPLHFEGQCYGEISTDAKGGAGFGYDPVFLVKQLGKTFAELTPEEKHALSHRGQAIKQLLTQFI